MKTENSILQFPRDFIALANKTNAHPFHLYTIRETTHLFELAPTHKVRLTVDGPFFIIISNIFHNLLYMIYIKLKCYAKAPPPVAINNYNLFLEKIFIFFVLYIIKIYFFFEFK